MADELLGVLGPSDFSAFQNSVVQNDPYGIMGRSLTSWQPNTATWSPETTAATAFGKAFLAGMLGNYARQNAADQINSVAAVLPQLQKDPMNLAAPEGVDSDAFAALRGTAILKNYQNQILSGQANSKGVSELMQTVLAKGVESGTISPAQALKAAQSGKYDEITNTTLGPLDNPTSREYKLEQDKIKGIDDLRSKFEAKQEVKDFSTIQAAASALSGALKDTGKVSDQELVRYSIQMIEPGMAVREGEQSAVANSQNITDAWKGELKAALEGKSSLGPDVREGIKRLAARAYEGKRQQYDKALTYYQGLGEGRGLLGEGQSISYLGKAPPAVDVFGPIKDSVAPPQGQTIKAPDGRTIILVD